MSEQDDIKIKQPLMPAEEFKKFVTDKMKLEVPHGDERARCPEMMQIELQTVEQLRESEKNLVELLNATRKQLLAKLNAETEGKTWCACNINNGNVCGRFKSMYPGSSLDYCFKCGHLKDCHKPNIGFIGQ